MRVCMPGGGATDGVGLLACPRGDGAVVTHCHPTPHTPLAHASPLPPVRLYPCQPCFPRFAPTPATGRARFGQLPRETQKAINSLCARAPSGDGCEAEIAAFLRCLKKADWDSAACQDSADAVRKCSSAADEKVGVGGRLAGVFKEEERVHLSACCVCVCAGDEGRR